jgi:hypothetical protein
MFPDDILSLIFQLLRDNWDDTNTSNITPLFGTGYLEGQGGPHQVQTKNIPRGPLGYMVSILRLEWLISCFAGCSL